MFYKEIWIKNTQFTVTMRISNIQLKNFKRFTNLKIEAIPVTTRLVLVIGANGSGKSSLFDAFSFINNSSKNDVGNRGHENYYGYFKKDKDTLTNIALEFHDSDKVDILIPSNNRVTVPEGAIYGRTSSRQIPRLTRTSMGQSRLDLAKDNDRPKFLIERDNRFENDVEKITGTILKEFYRSDQSKAQIFSKYINPINEALSNVFGGKNGTQLSLLEIIPPLEGKTAQITFKKGNSEFHYNLLSAGEKEVFNLLVNLLVRREFYQNTIFYFDEIDLHLNTKIQFNLLKEITENWIPGNCQLWTASHSLGFIEYAKQAESAEIIDFDSYDFDVPRILMPESKDNPDIYEIAVGKDILPSLFKDMRICFVENKDRLYYAQAGIPQTVFVPGNSRNNVYHKVKSSEYLGIVDRDFLSDEDIIEIRKQYPRLFLLKLYSIENYLYHPENLEEFYQKKEQPFDKQQYIKDLTREKNVTKNVIIPGLSLKRTEYPYFSEPPFNGKSNQNRFKNKGENQQQSIEIAKYLNSDDFTDFYKVLPMKSYAKNLPQRQNIGKSELAKTDWVKKQIEAIFNEKE